MEEEFSWSSILVFRVSMSVGIEWNQGIGKKKLSTTDRYEGSFEADMAGFDGFYLAARQHNACHIPVEEGVVVGGAAIESKVAHSLLRMKCQGV